MENIYVYFGIRLRSNEALSEIGKRVGRVLNCPFVPLQDSHYPDARLLQAEAFCFKLLISKGVFQGDLTAVYQLNGENIIEPRWDYSNELDLTPWILQEFRHRDSPDWYVPTVDELKKQAEIE
jgi:hypothetical protein